MEHLGIRLQAHRPFLRSRDQLQLMSMGIGIGGAADDRSANDQHPEQRQKHFLPQGTVPRTVLDNPTPTALPTDSRPPGNPKLWPARRTSYRINGMDSILSRPFMSFFAKKKRGDLRNSNPLIDWSFRLFMTRLLDLSLSRLIIYHQ
jgi:hypothetical protein